jgi:ATP-dependent RNA helicase DDX1
MFYTRQHATSNAAPSFPLAQQVWFHKCANRGKGCSDTRLAPAGCTVWYDEPALLGGILRRLHITSGTLPTMAVARDAPTAAGQLLPYLFSLPPAIASLGTVYGEERGERAGPSAHVELIRDQVQALAALEVQVQSSFLAMKTRFSVDRPTS